MADYEDISFLPSCVFRHLRMVHVFRETPSFRQQILNRYKADDITILEKATLLKKKKFQVHFRVVCQKRVYFLKKLNKQRPFQQ